MEVFYHGERYKNSEVLETSEFYYNNYHSVGILENYGMDSAILINSSRDKYSPETPRE